MKPFATLRNTVLGATALGMVGLLATSAIATEPVIDKGVPIATVTVGDYTIAFTPDERLLLGDSNGITTELTKLQLPGETYDNLKLYGTTAGVVVARVIIPVEIGTTDDVTAKILESIAVLAADIEFGTDDIAKLPTIVLTHINGVGPLGIAVLLDHQQTASLSIDLIMPVDPLGETKQTATLDLNAPVGDKDVLLASFAEYAKREREIIGNTKTGGGAAAPTPQ